MTRHAVFDTLFKTDMSSFSFRPSFSHELDMPVERAVETIVGRVSQEPASFEVRSFPGFICLRIPVSDRHFWTPRLMLGMEKSSGGDKTSVHGTYGPNANVWSLYLYGFLIIGTGGVFSGILGFCQWQLGMTAWGLVDLLGPPRPRRRPLPHGPNRPKTRRPANLHPPPSLRTRRRPIHPHPLKNHPLMASVR